MYKDPDQLPENGERPDDKVESSVCTELHLHIARVATCTLIGDW
jgi:hypothetical protein